MLIKYDELLQHLNNYYYSEFVRFSIEPILLKIVDDNKNIEVVKIFQLKDKYGYDTNGYDIEVSYEDQEYISDLDGIRNIVTGGMTSI